ncbi:hypothetical protein DBR40_03710 [Pedobacter sp. KBW01]|nr:hypothetical protein DBR40_03710 [Pedobacter sp. KBW01]
MLFSKYYTYTPGHWYS